MDINAILDTLKKSYPIQFDNIELLRDWSGFVCTVTAESTRYICKVYREFYHDKGLQSIDIMTYLHGCRFPVPPIVPAQDNSPFVYLDTETGKKLCVLFGFIEGVDPDITVDTEAFGQQVAEMHNIMACYTGELVRYSKPYFIDFYITKLNAMGYSNEKISLISEYGDELWRKVQGLPKGFCHGDLHTGNMLLAPSGQNYIFDFDLASYSFPVFDAMTLCDRTDYFDFKSDGIDKVTETLERFRTGYEKVRHLSDEEVSAVYYFIGIRHFQLQAQIIDRFGLDCVDLEFLDKQYEWLMKWRDQCGQRGL